MLRRLAVASTAIAVIAPISSLSGFSRCYAIIGVSSLKRRSKKASSGPGELENEKSVSGFPARPKHRVVIVGAGFGGIEVARGLAGSNVEITILDERNHHLFQPLLYQVATASLSPSEIAWPTRSIFRHRRDVKTLLVRASGVLAAEKQVILENGGALPFDTLVLATGARHSYFDHPEWEAQAPGLKSFEDATDIRRRILLAFEEGELEADSDRRDALLTFVVVGGGPTRVELAGAIADLARDTLAPDFQSTDTRRARVILIEAGDCLLPGYPAELSEYTKRALEQLGVEVHLGASVTHIDDNCVAFGPNKAAAQTVVWAAGVRASPAAEWLAAESDKAGRIIVEPNLAVAGHPDIFAIGDTAKMTTATGAVVPGIAPAAKQSGRYVAQVVRSRLSGRPPPAAFKYRHFGSLAQIGNRRAVIDFGWTTLRGAASWWVWGITHIYFLVGVRTRLAVVLDRFWISLRNQRSARLISRPRTKSEALADPTRRTAVSRSNGRP